MADYWVSQAKKQCEYCKCWIADNRPSIDFHERGKNHQENVRKRLADLRKKTTLKRKQDEEFKSDFAKMEASAMAAMKKDIEANPGIIGSSDARTLLSYNSKQNSNASKSEPSSDPTKDNKKSAKTTQANSKNGGWEKMTAVQGHSYYYNNQTGESRWKKPKEYNDDKLNKSVSSSSKVKSNVKSNSSTDPKDTLLGGWVTVEKQLPDPNLLNENKDEKPVELENVTETVVHKKNFQEKVLDTSENDETATLNVEFKKRKFGKKKLRTRDPSAN